ncbi:MAG: hypothetical protein HRT87_08595 [Legionellales bacterium]|nr:hypothetical protein [Legionellales bacterium]
MIGTADSKKIGIIYIYAYYFVLIFSLVGCSSENHKICSKGSFKGGWVLVCQDIDDNNFKTLDKYNKIVIIQALYLTNAGLSNNHWITSLHLHDIPHINNAGLQGLDGLEHLYLEKMPNISQKGIMHLKKLKTLYLWNMNHISNKDLAKLREKGVKIIDARSNKRQNFTAWE